MCLVKNFLYYNVQVKLSSNFIDFPANTYYPTKYILLKCNACDFYLLYCLLLYTMK